MVVLAPTLDGCSSSGGQIACTDSITQDCHFDCSKSIEELCATVGGCDLTWDAVLADPGLCTAANQPPATIWTNSVYECGNYRVLAGGGEAGGATGYYDLATAKLVAEIEVGHSLPMFSCAGGPAGGFMVPNCSASTPLPPPICSTLDGGADGP